MSSLVKLSSRLPGDPEINGLDSLADKLLDLDAEPTVALVWLSTAKVTTDRPHDDDAPSRGDVAEVFVFEGRDK